MSPMRISFPRALSLVAIAAVLSAGCGGDDGNGDPTGPEQPAPLRVADLVGSWKASSMLFTSTGSPTQQFDVVSAGGEFRVTVLTGGGARHWLTIGTVDDEWDALLSISGDQLTSIPAESFRGTRHHTVKLEGGILTLTRTNASFDFSLSGGAGEPATEKVVMYRN